MSRGKRNTELVPRAEWVVELEPISSVRPAESQIEEITAEPPLVITCGELASSASRLLAGRKIDIAATRSIASALRLARRSPPEVFLTSFELLDGSGLDLLAELSQHVDPVPCAVVLDRSEWQHVGACVSEGAFAVLEEGDTRGVLTALGPRLGLRASLEPRAPFDTAIEVEIAGERYAAETVDLRPSGVALEHLPEAAEGARVKVRFELDARTLEVWGRVARVWERGGRAGTAVEFMGLPAKTQRWLRRSIEGQAKRSRRKVTSEGEWRDEIRRLFADHSRAE